MDKIKRIRKINYDDTYTLTMTCSEFVGKYSGKVSIKRY